MKKIWSLQDVARRWGISRQRMQQYKDENRLPPPELEDQEDRPFWFKCPPSPALPPYRPRKKRPR